MASSKNIEFESVLTLGDGSSWVEITNDELAQLATAVSRTAMQHYYGFEREAGPHLHKWYFLLTEVSDENSASVGGFKQPIINGKEMFSPVCLAVLPDDLEPQSFKLNKFNCHVTGFANANPYPEYEDAIKLLEEEIGITITPNWQGKPIENDMSSRPSM